MIVGAVEIHVKMVASLLAMIAIIQVSILLVFVYSTIEQLISLYNVCMQCNINTNW